MKKNKLFILVMIVLTVKSLARKTDDQIFFKKENSLIKIFPKSGYHLNDKAPATAKLDGQDQVVAPIRKISSEFIFDFKNEVKNLKIKNVNLNFYVCDNLNTVCEQHVHKLDISDAKEVKTKNVEFAIVKSESDSRLKRDHLSPEKSVAEIKNETNSQSIYDEKSVTFISKNGKPSLIVFSAPWCPACIRLQTETFPNITVLNELKNVNFIKLNNDLSENYELSKKFHIKAIPTLILLNPNGEEIFRWIDFQPAKAFAVQLKNEANQSKMNKEDLSITNLQKKAQGGDIQAASKLGRLFYNALDCEQAIKWLSISKDKNDILLNLSAQVSCAEGKSTEGTAEMQMYLKTLEQAIFSTTSSVDKIRWSVELLEKKNKTEPGNFEIKNKAKELVLNLEQLSKNPKKLVREFKESTFGEVGGFEFAELYLMQSRLYQVLEEETLKNKSFQKIVQNIISKKLNVNRPGELLLGIAYLREAGEKSTVDDFYNQLILKFPFTYVYHEKYSRYLLKEKNFDKSLLHADLAFKNAQGNLPQLFLLKAKILTPTRAAGPRGLFGT